MSEQLMMVEILRGGRASVSAYADAMAYHDSYASVRRVHDAEDRFGAASLYAMSIVGNEQAVRAIASACSLEKESQRPSLRFSVNGMESITVQWCGRWSCTAQNLGKSTLHLVAVPPFDSHGIAGKGDKDTGDTEQTHLVMPTIGTAGKDGDLERQIYRRLLTCFDTPLLPIDIPGQPDVEREAAAQWAIIVAKTIMEDTELWRPLRLHPSQPNRDWENSGLLMISPKRLDGLIGQLVSQGVLDFPGRSQYDQVMRDRRSLLLKSVTRLRRVPA